MLGPQTSSPKPRVLSPRKRVLSNQPGEFPPPRSSLCLHCSSLSLHGPLPPSATSARAWLLWGAICDAKQPLSSVECDWAERALTCYMQATLVACCLVCSHPFHPLLTRRTGGSTQARSCGRHIAARPVAAMRCAGASQGPRPRQQPHTAFTHPNLSVALPPS